MTRKQPHHMTALEAIANIVIGIGVAYAATWYALLYLGITITRDQNLQLTVIMTVVSFIRQYGVRRIFEALR